MVVQPLDDGSRKDLTQLFPEIKPLDECDVSLTKKKLKHDEVKIVERLIAKYGAGPENHGRMFKDIKLNYLQWSKGQISQKIQVYLGLN